MNDLEPIVAPVLAGLVLGQDAEDPGIPDDGADGRHPPVLVIVDTAIDRIFHAHDPRLSGFDHSKFASTPAGGGRGR